MTNKGMGNKTQICAFGGSPYGTSSGSSIWVGQVQENTIDQDEGIIPNRYVGGTMGDRNVEGFLRGATKYVNSLKYWPQDGKMLGFCLGSVYTDTAGSPIYKHYVSELSSSGNIPYFTIEDFQGFVANEDIKKTLNGCVCDNLTISGKEGAEIEIAIDGPLQYIDKGSGSETAVSASTKEPYRMDMCLLAGSCTQLDGDFQSLNSFDFNLKNNLQIKHYATGSKYISRPIEDGRDYLFSTKTDIQTATGATLYDMYKAGSQINLDLFFLRASGSDDFQLWMSGCELLTCDSPTKKEGITPQDIDFQPTSCGIIVSDDIESYPEPIYV